MRRVSRRCSFPGPVLSLVFGLALLSGCAGAQERDAEPSRAKSVILFIGDGVDDHQLTIGRNYLHGAGGTLLFEGLEHRATARVLTVQEDEPSKPEYVADSASGGTALSAGVVTSRGRIATTAGSDEDVATIVELAKQAGKKTGVVATSSITDATPASFYAHVRFRFCEGPEDMDGGRTPPCPQDKVERRRPGIDRGTAGELRCRRGSGWRTGDFRAGDPCR